MKYFIIPLAFLMLSCTVRVGIRYDGWTAKQQKQIKLERIIYRGIICPNCKSTLIFSNTWIDTLPPTAHAVCKQCDITYDYCDNELSKCTLK